MKKFDFARKLTALALVFMLMFAATPLNVTGFLPDAEEQHELTLETAAQPYLIYLAEFDDFFVEQEVGFAPMSSIANVCAFCVVENMGPGWNLGNTFDATHIGHGSSCSGCIPNSSSPPGGGAGTGIWACPTRNYIGMAASQLETIWIGGSANVTTQQTIRNVRNAGFTTIRIPVTWYKATAGPPNWVIRDDFMARVRNVVRWAYDEDMTIILNTHHEELIFANWLGDARRTESQNFITRIWTQIATEFNGFGERLVFEGLNEPRVRGHAQEWQGGSPEHRENVNRLNQAFVNAVRATGGNNRYRILMVPTYAASADIRAFAGFTIPTDPTAGPQRIAMSIHAYIPNSFAGVGSGPITHTFGSTERNQVTTMMNRVMNEANTRNVPVVFGEWGAVSRSSGTNENTRAEYSRVYALEAASRRAAHVWWDNGATDPARHDIIEGNFGLFNRRNANIGTPRVPHMGLVFPNITDAIVLGHSQGVSRRQSVSGDSRCQCIAVTSVNTLSVQQGVGGSLPLTANRSPVTWAFGTGAGNTPPAGVTISGGNLNVATTVPVGTYTFQVRATSGSLVATQTFTLRVLAAGQAPPGRNYRNLNMSPGANETIMRFTWHSGYTTGSVRIWPQDNPAAARTINSTTTEGNFIVDRPGGEGGIAQYHVHLATVSGLSRNTVYQYTIRWGTSGESTPKAFRTGGGSSFQFLVAGDPQIGTGGIEFDRSDWSNTMVSSVRAFPHAQFIVSMGDQTASAPLDPAQGTPANADPSTPNPLQLRGAQRRFDGLFAPVQMHSLPLAPVVGNHENDTGGNLNMNPHLWRSHYNVPNRAQINSALPTNFDYYFRYGDVLFIHINSNTGFRIPTDTRRNWLNGVINRNQDALWRVVIMHHSPYSAYRASNYTPKTQIIANWIPVFEEHDIDIVFGGHDHIYSRTHHMRRGSGSAPTARLDQRFVNSAGIVRQGNFGATYHAVLNPVGITYLSFGSPTRSNARPSSGGSARDYLVRHHSVHRMTVADEAADNHAPNTRHISTVTVTPQTFSVATYELDNANRFRMVDLYTIIRNPGSTQVPSGIYIPVFNDSWQEVPDPYIDIPFNWNLNLTLPDINVSYGATNHIRILDGLEITPCIIDSDDDIVLRFNYFPVGNNSNRRLLAWTDLSSSAANRNSIAFLTTANLSDNSVAISERVEAGATTAQMVIPRGILSSGTATATRLYIAMGIDAGPIGHPTGGEPNRYTNAADHRGQTEFERIDSVQLIARAASGVGNPIACIACSNLPCRCVETRLVEFRPNGGTRTGGGDLTQNIPLGGAAVPPVLTREGYTFTWDAMFHNVTANVIVTAQWIPLGAPINVLYDMQTTTRVGPGGFADFGGTGALPGTMQPLFAPLGRAGAGTTTYATTSEQARSISVTARGGVSQAVFITLGGTGGLGSAGLPTTAGRMYRIEYTAMFPNGGTPRIRLEGAAAHVAQIPGGAEDGTHVVVDGSEVGAGVVFTHSVTLTHEQLTAIGARNVSLSAIENDTNIVYGNIRIVEHGVPPATFTITFNPNGGEVSPTSATTGADGRLTSLPSPTRDGYDFDGWFTAVTGGTEVTTATVFTSSITIFAQWTEIVLPTFTITFNPNGGTVTPTSAVSGIDGRLASLPTPARANYNFNGWFTAVTGGTEVTTATVFTVNTTIFARWTAMTTPHTITFNPNGGTFINLSEATREVPRGDRVEVGMLPRSMAMHSRIESGYRFSGWFENIADESTRWSDDTVVNDSITLNARWTAISEPQNFRVGDANRDGRITSADVTAMARLLINQPPVNVCRLRADIEGRGYLLPRDVTTLAMWLMGHDEDENGVPIVISQW